MIIRSYWRFPRSYCRIKKAYCRIFSSYARVFRPYACIFQPYMPSKVSCNRVFTGRWPQSCSHYPNRASIVTPSCWALVFLPYQLDLSMFSKVFILRKDSLPFNFRVCDDNLVKWASNDDLLSPALLGYASLR